jgi:phage terminase small subunit
MRKKKIKPVIQPESAIQDVEVVEVAEILNETAKTIDELRLKPEWRVFVQEYTYDWNGSRAYKVAYPNSKDETARSAASILITNPNIKQAIQLAQKDLERMVGISKQMVLREEMKIAFSSIAHLHNTWMERKDFEELTEDQKACIQEIDTKVVQDKEGTTVYFKIKLYDKQKSLEAIRKMLGYNEEKALVNVEVNNNTQNNYYASVKDALQSAGILKPKP